MDDNTATRIMDAAAVERSLMRIAHEIAERNSGVEDVCLIGIRRRGAPMARMIAACIKCNEGRDVEVGDLDITFYRDDLSRLYDTPTVNGQSVDFSVEGRTVVLVDDVLYTGRTARAAIDAVFSMGRPGRIQLAILIDRGHRELPIRADYVGKNLPTSRLEKVKVLFPQYDSELGVILAKP